MRHFLTICVFALMSSGQAQLPSYVPTQDLVAWYPMNNSGDDFSGNGFHGEVIGSTFTHDRFGSELSSAYFDWSAVEGYGNPWHRIEINPGFDGTLNGTFTVAAWIRPEHYYWPQNSAHSAMIFGYASRCPNTAGLRFSIEGEGALRLRWGNNAISDEGAVVLNEWQHVVGTIAQDSMRVYINGVQVGSAPAVEGPTSGCFNIGELHQANGHWYYFDGAIDDLGVWDHALSESEISALYNSAGIILSCTDPAACNYEPTATQDDGSCDYTCCPGPGCCDVGMHWDWELGMCQITNVADTNLDGCVQLNDLLDVLSAYGNCTEAEVAEHPCSGGAFSPGDDLACAGWNYLGAYDGGEYYVSSFPLAWDSAQAFAAELNGGLAVISSEEENDWISDLVGDTYVWIGLYQDLNSTLYSEPDGGWLWVDGSSVDFENWASNSPNNVNNGTEHHCQMYSNGLWNDAPGNLFINGSDGRDIYAVIEFR